MSQAPLFHSLVSLLGHELKAGGLGGGTDGDTAVEMKIEDLLVCWSCRRWATRREASACLSFGKRNGPWQCEVAGVVEGDGMAEPGSS